MADNHQTVPELLPGKPATPGAVYGYGRATQWAWECWVCPERGFNFASKAKAEDGFTAHRATYHALSA